MTETAPTLSSKDIANAMAQAFKENGLVLQPDAKPAQSSQFQQLYDRLAAHPETDKGQLDLLREALEARENDRTTAEQKNFEDKTAKLIQSMGTRQAETAVRAEIHRLTDGDEQLSKLKDEIAIKAFRTFNESEDYKQARYDVTQCVVDPAVVQSLVKGAIKHYSDILPGEKSKSLSGMSGSVASSQAGQLQQNDDKPASADDLNSRQREWYDERFTHARIAGYSRDDAHKEAMRSALSINLLKKAM